MNSPVFRFFRHVSSSSHLQQLCPFELCMQLFAIVHRVPEARCLCVESTSRISSPFGHLNVVGCNLTLKSSKGKDSKGESGDKKGVDLVPTIREQRNFSGLKSTPVTRAVCPTMCIMNMNGKKSPSTRCNYSASKANRIVSFLL